MIRWMFAWLLWSCGASVHAAAVSIGVNEAGGVPVPVLRFDGVILAGDLALLKSFVLIPVSTGLAPGLKQHIAIELNSAGGDIDEAMRIGRWVREQGLTAIVKRDAICHSACVNILAGALKRTVEGSVAIHRVAVDPRLDDVGAEATAVLQSQRDYFLDMNIPVELADVAASTPFDQMDVLSPERLRQYRLNQDDFVFEESWMLAAAAQSAMSPSRFREALSKADADAALACAKGREQALTPECLSRFYSRHPLTKSLDHPRFHFVASVFRPADPVNVFCWVAVPAVLISIVATLLAPLQRPVLPTASKFRWRTEVAPLGSVIVLTVIVAKLFDKQWVVTSVSQAAWAGVFVLAALLCVRALLAWKGWGRKLLALPALVFWFVAFAGALAKL